ncbi:hypothetical protein CCP3SC1_130015 [Gammaproteobacteria bacterium]
MPNPPFIKSLHIHKVRHLENIDISLDENRPRHLILTGPNGSGKTSVLLAIKDYLNGIPNRDLMELEQRRNNINSSKNSIKHLEAQLKQPNRSEQQKTQQRIQISEYRRSIENNTKYISSFERIETVISDLPGMIENYHQGDYLIAFFDSKRLAKLEKVSGVQKIDIPEINPIESGRLASKFLQFLVNQENKIGMFHYQGNHERAHQLTQ